jgi:hypothetical protein
VPFAIRALVGLGWFHSTTTERFQRERGQTSQLPGGAKAMQPVPFESGWPDWNECGATHLKPLAHALRGSLLRGGEGKRVQGCVKEKGCEEGRATWVKRCPSGRLYAPPPGTHFPPLSLKDRSLNPCAQRFHPPAVSSSSGFTLQRCHLSSCTHFFHLSLLRIARSIHVHSGFTWSGTRFEVQWLRYLDLSDWGCLFGRVQSQCPL